MSEKIITQEELNFYKMRENLVRDIYNSIITRKLDLTYIKDLINYIPKEILNDYEDGVNSILHDMALCYEMCPYFEEDFFELWDLLLSKLTIKTIHLKDENNKTAFEATRCGIADVLFRRDSYIMKQK